MRLRLHKKYGVNPSLGVCFWCRRETGEVLLLGANGGKKAEMYTVVSYDPCPACEKIWERGIALIKVLPRPITENQAPIQDGFYPSGDLVVVKRSVVKTKEILDAGQALIDQETWAALGLDDELANTHEET